MLPAHSALVDTSTLSALPGFLSCIKAALMARPGMGSRTQAPLTSTCSAHSGVDNRVANTTAKLRIIILRLNALTNYKPNHNRPGHAGPAPALRQIVALSAHVHRAINTLRPAASSVHPAAGPRGG